MMTRDESLDDVARGSTGCFREARGERREEWAPRGEYGGDW